MSALSRKNVENISLGQYGAEVINDTNSHTIPLQALQCLTDVVISSVTWLNLTGTITGITIPSGTVLFGQISKISLTSGIVIGYKQGID